MSTVTVPLKLTVRVTAVAAPKTPLPLVMPVPEVATEEMIGTLELVISTLATEVCHQLLATYSFEIQNAFGLVGSGIAVE